MSKKNSIRWSRFAFLQKWGAEDPFEAPQASCLSICHRFWPPFSKDFAWFWHTNWRLPNSPATKFADRQRPKNLPKPAKNCRELPRTARIFAKLNAKKETQTSKLQSTNCLSQNAVSRHKRRATKWGGGGARAARRIRIRRPRLRGRGVQDPGPNSAVFWALTATALPADPAPSLRKLCLQHPNAAIFVIFGRQLADLKTHPKSASSKSFEKSQKSARWAPKSRFLVDFGSHFGIHFR